MSVPSKMKLKFIGCEIIYREACHLAAISPHLVDVEFLRKGLHDLETSDMLAKLQATIDAIEPAAGYDAVLLGYARCNDGVVGVAARDIPLIIPRAHDCITMFFGSRQGYKEYFDEHPGTYYMSTGWSERNTADGGEPGRPAYGQQGVMAKLGLTDSYEELVAKHGKENADFIVESLGDWKSNYSNMLYLEMGLCDETPFVEKARELAGDRNWTFEQRKGEWTLLEKLFFGQWDGEFVTINPGQTLAARNDESILEAEG